MIKSLLISGIVITILPCFLFAHKRHKAFKEVAKILKDEIYIRTILSSDYYIGLFSFIASVLFYGLFFIGD